VAHNNCWRQLAVSVEEGGDGASEEKSHHKRTVP